MQLLVSRISALRNCWRLGSLPSGTVRCKAHLQKFENLLGTYNILLKNYVYAENRSFVMNVAIIWIRMFLRTNCSNNNYFKVCFAAILFSICVSMNTNPWIPK